MVDSGGKKNRTTGSTSKPKKNSKEKNATSYDKTETISEKALLLFGKQILLGLLFVFVFCSLMGVFFKVQFFFDVLKMGVLPIFASVVTYYFTKK